MSDTAVQAGIYTLSGTGIEVEYRSGEGKLTMKGEKVIGDDRIFDAPAEVKADVGILLSATTLDSSRNGTRVTVLLLLPELEELGSGGDPVEATGVATIVADRRRVTGGGPPVLQSYDVVELTGTVAAG